MRITFLSAAAGLLLTSLLLTPETTQAQASPPASQSAPKGAKPKKAPVKPKKAPAQATKAPAAPVVIDVKASNSNSKRKGVVLPVTLPETPEVQDARKRVEIHRAEDLSTYEEAKAQLEMGQYVLYDDHITRPTNSVMGNLERWNDHLVLQLGLRQTGLDKVLETESVILLAPADNVLLPRNPNLRFRRGAVERYVIRSKTPLSEVKEGEPVTFVTLADTKLVVTRSGKNLSITDEDKQTIHVTVADIPCANGFISIVDQAFAGKVK